MAFRVGETVVVVVAVVVVVVVVVVWVVVVVVVVVVGGTCRPLHFPCPYLGCKLVLPTQGMHRNITHSFFTRTARGSHVNQRAARVRAPAPACCPRVCRAPAVRAVLAARGCATAATGLLNPMLQWQHFLWFPALFLVPNIVFGKKQNWC